MYPESRSALLPMLHLFQSEEGWVSPEAQRACAEMLDLPPSIVESTASFYTLFFKRPVGKYMLQPCRNLGCIINGAEETTAYFREQLGIGHLQTHGRRLVLVRGSRVFGRVRPGAVHAGQLGVRLRSDARENRRDARGDAGRNVSRSRRCRRRRSRARPGTWRQETGQKSAGAQGVASPNDPGGIGDRSGASMLRLIEQIRIRSTCGRRASGLVADGRRSSKRSFRPRDGARTDGARIRCLTAGIGELNLRDIEVYRAQGGYAQFERAVTELDARRRPRHWRTSRGCAGAAGRVFRPDASGAFCPTTAARVISSATATRPSRARSKITC